MFYRYFEVKRPQKFCGSVPCPPRAMSPLNFFWLWCRSNACGYDFDVGRLGARRIKLALSLLCANSCFLLRIGTEIQLKLRIIKYSFTKRSLSALLRGHSCLWSATVKCYLSCLGTLLHLSAFPLVYVYDFVIVMLVRIKLHISSITKLALIFWISLRFLEHFFAHWCGIDKVLLRINSRKSVSCISELRPNRLIDRHTIWTVNSQI